MLDPAELRPWAHWVTPEFEPRRYDTHFFVAELPPGQRARDLSGETDRAEWTAPAAALAAERDGRIALMPPTLSILLELADCGSIAEVRPAGRGPGRLGGAARAAAYRRRVAVRLSAAESLIMAGLPVYLQLVRAPNPGPMTLDGTNTWILGDPAIGAPAVLDPGPAISSSRRGDPARLSRTGLRRAADAPAS